MYASPKVKLSRKGGPGRPGSGCSCQGPEWLMGRSSPSSSQFVFMERRRFPDLIREQSAVELLSIFLAVVQRRLSELG